MSAQDDSSGEVEIYELSPFSVDAGDSQGYLATSTLSGTRIKSSLRDIASSISIYTQEFIADTAAVDAKDLLLYTTGTEVSGLGGSLVVVGGASSLKLELDGERFSPSPTTRLRGLAAAKNSRDNFDTLIPMDTYNIDRVTINRGANNVLFGLGSPAGIIDRSLVRPMSVNTTQFQTRTDKYGSLRTVWDVNRTFMDQKVNARIIALHDWREFRQNRAFDKNRRLYGALDIQLAENTLLRINSEFGDREGVPEILAPPYDRIAPFWNEGKPTQDVGTVSFNIFSEPRGGLYRVWDNPGLFSRSPNIVYDNGQVQVAYQTRASGGGLKGAVLDSSDPLYQGILDGKAAGVLGSEKAKPENYQPWMFTMLDQVDIARREGDELMSFARTPQNLDTSVFDYNNRSMTGRNDRITNKFKTYNLSLQQEFLDGDLGLELTRDYQEFDNATFAFARGGGTRNNTLNIDGNRVRLDGTPNSNFGRIFTSFRPSWDESESELETNRATVFYKFDADERLDGFWKWLGKHTFTGLFADTELNTRSSGGYQHTFTEDFGNAIGFRAKEMNIESNSLGGSVLYYLSDKVSDGASPPTGLNIQGLPDYLPLPGQVNVNPYVDAESRSFTSGAFDTYNYLEDKDVLRSRATLRNSNPESMALAWQSRWLNEHVVGTLGWRNDKFTRFDAGVPPRNALRTALISHDVYSLPTEPEVDADVDTFSWGVVGHAPQFVKDILPPGTDVSLHYATSENFSPNLTARNPFGGVYDVPRGVTNDFGATISILDNKIVARMTWYETDEENKADARLTSIYDWFFRNIPIQVYGNNDIADVEAANLAMPAQSIQEAYNWRFTTQPDGNLLLEGDSIGATDITTTTSKGFEIDLTANLTSNWRVSLNAAQQKASLTGTAQTAGDEVRRLIEEWDNNPAMHNVLVTPAESFFGANRLPLEIANFKRVLVEEGKNVDRLREWRINAITNYTFSDDTKLKGWGVGGAVRWQSENSIGADIINDPELGLVPDVSNPIWGPEDMKIDAWITYRTRLMDKIDWKIQLNVRNVLNDDDLVPIYWNPGGWPKSYALGKERDWYISSTFMF